MNLCNDTINEIAGMAARDHCPPGYDDCTLVKPDPLFSGLSAGVDCYGCWKSWLDNLFSEGHQ